MTVIRQASHAGSWYEKRSTILDNQMKNWLSKVFESTPGQNVKIPIINSKAFIVPHAGYSYSGPAAAFSYQSIDIEPIKRVFILGPSHHFYLPGCALTNCDEYETPLGNLIIDKDIINELKETGEFDKLSIDADEDEHSIEMQLPYIYKVFESKIDEIKIVPILVGGLDTDGERDYGKLLSKYLKDPANLFLISSDFCHWGSRFRYTFYSDKTPPSKSPSNVRNTDKFTIPIHQSIENLDREGMEKIETLSLDQFATYLSKTKNTICGRHPIGVLLGMVEDLYPGFERQFEQEPEVEEGDIKDNAPYLKFIHYSQSSQVTDPSDSSVSYAAAYLYLPPN